MRNFAARVFNSPRLHHITMTNTKLEDVLNRHSKSVADVGGQRCADLMTEASKETFALGDLLDDLGLTHDMKVTVMTKMSVITSLAMAGEQEAARFQMRMLLVARGLHDS